MMSLPYVHRVLALTSTLVIALVIIAPLAGCSGFVPRIQTGSAPYTLGSGTTTTVTRSVGAFHAVSASAGIMVVIHTGQPGTVSVTADDNLVAQVSTEVRDGTLYVGIEGGVETRSALRVELANSAIDAITASTGATVDAEAISAQAVSVEATTGATVRAGGRVDALRVTSNSGATADLRNVEAATVDVHVTMGATAQIYPIDAVTGACTGGATLVIRGHPAHNDVSKDEASTITSS